MENPLIALDLTLLDVLALTWFFICWMGFQYFADHSRWHKRSLTIQINEYRLEWMRQMLQRDVRMVDTTLLGNLLTAIGFFASTTILVLGGLFALLANADIAMQALTSLPFAKQTSLTVWEFKVLLLMSIFVHAFFKFGWAFRLNNYCSILIGAAPPPETLSPERERYAHKTAQLSINAGKHFNRGLRTYFFGLAAIGWFYHPLALVIVSTIVVCVLYRREFSSAALFSLVQAEEN
ncbi:DUF599 domain-containing protein [Curvivirga aplysinae]|uniref:DUF599 domain-containing protein n=1 Tax=Curvivirga aplysinae TaxID=2529852 RepID=UPI0012BCF187|nr:DUF599 domain-containing protein [Curvivirga aplysinae]MTI10138.1 DUF599 family protein [Curvivirga aplysinae]